MSLFTDWMARRHGGLAAFYEDIAAPLERAGVASIRVAQGMVRVPHVSA